MAIRPVNDLLYWASLERRVSRKLSEQADKSLRYYWCDGLLPSSQNSISVGELIGGKAWIVHGQDQQLWDFKLMITGKGHEGSPETGVLQITVFDNENRRLEMTLGQATA